MSLTIRPPTAILVMAIRFSELESGGWAVADLVNDNVDDRNVPGTLREPVDYLRSFIDKTVDAIVVVQDQKVIYSNRAIEGLFGYNREEIIGRSYLDIITEPFRDMVKERYSKRMADEEVPPLLEIEVICRDGSKRPVEISSSPISHDGRKASILIVRDISARRAVEGALRESEAKYKTLSENMTDAIIVNIDGRCVWVNRAFTKILGYSFGEAMGKTVEDLAHPDELPGIYERMRKRSKGESLSPFYQTILVRKNGEPIDVEASASPVIFERRQAMQIIIRDVTDRKLSEMALIRSEKKYRLLFENAEEAIFLVGEDGVFRMMNKKAAAYLGGKAEDFIGKNMSDLFPPKIAARQMGSIRKVLESNQSAVFQSRTILNHVERTFRTSIIPVADIFGLNRTAQLIAHDITEVQQRQLQDKVRLDLHELLRSARAIDDCLKLGCEAVFKAELFKRAVFTLHDKKRQITNIGYIGIDRKTAEKARKAPPPSTEMARKMMQNKYKVGNSYFIPVEAAFGFESTPRFISQKTRTIDLSGAWRNGDELFVPVIRAKGDIVGWLSVDTPFNKLRPEIDIIRFLEQIADIVYFKVRDISNIGRIEAEGTALKEKNIALKEVLSHIEEEKIALKQEVAGQIERVILPAMDKAVDKKGHARNKFVDIVKTHLLNLASFSSGSTHIYSKLSRRESEICQLIKAGNTNKEISALLAISISTVHKHRESIRRKFGLKNKPQNLSVFLAKLDYP